MISILGLSIDYFLNQSPSMVRIKEKECLPVSQQADSQAEEAVAGLEEQTKTLEFFLHVTVEYQSECCRLC